MNKIRTNTITRLGSCNYNVFSYKVLCCEVREEYWNSEIIAEIVLEKENQLYRGTARYSERYFHEELKRKGYSIHQDKGHNEWIKKRVMNEMLSRAFQDAILK